jgi:hypothetical protein
MVSALAARSVSPVPVNDDTLDTMGVARLLEALNNCDLHGCDGKHWWRDIEARPWVRSKAHEKGAHCGPQDAFSVGRP